jgi:hypothetical protein
MKKYTKLLEKSLILLKRKYKKITHCANSEHPNKNLITSSISHHWNFIQEGEKN